MKEVHYACGSSYKGDIVDKKRKGTGCFKYSNGEIYFGQFDNNLRHGQGGVTFSKESKFYDPKISELKTGYIGDKPVAKYEGEFQNGQITGYGTLTYLDGARFEGMVKHGKPEGAGMYIFKDISYSGEFSRGYFHGEGKLKFMYRGVLQTETGRFVFGQGPNSVLKHRCFTDTYLKSNLNKLKSDNYEFKVYSKDSCNGLFYFGEVNKNGLGFYVKKIMPPWVMHINFNKNEEKALESKTVLEVYLGYFSNGMYNGTGIQIVGIDCDFFAHVMRNEMYLAQELEQQVCYLCPKVSSFTGHGKVHFISNGIKQDEKDCVSKEVIQFIHDVRASDYGAHFENIFETSLTQVLHALIRLNTCIRFGVFTNDTMNDIVYDRCAKLL